MQEFCRKASWGVRALAFFALLVFVSFSVAAQLPTATVLGTVKDPTGGAVAGAAVTITNADTGVSRTSPSMDDGSYRFSALPVGNYEVKVMKDGFQTTTHTGITLVVGQDATIDFTLQVGSTSQTVEVTGEAPQVDTTSSSFGNLVNDQQVTDLPLNGRNWTDLTLMQPGVTQVNALNSFSGTGAAPVPPALNGTLFSTNGGTIRSNMIMLDGADERTLEGFNSTSAINSSLGVEGIKEYKVVTILPSAEYGLTMGSQTTIVSKGGTNQWHGGAFDFMRNASLDANNYNVTEDTANLNGCGTDKLLTVPCKRIPQFQRNNFGGSVGGPIQKDKTFFFAVYEGLEQRQGNSYTYTTLPADCFVNGSGQNLASGPNGLPTVSTAGAHIPAVIQSNGCVSGSASNPITVNSSILGLAQFFPVPNVPLTQATETYNFSNPYTIPTSESYGQIRVDRTLSANDNIFLRYTHDDSESYEINGNDVRNLLDANSSEIFTTLSETHIFSPTVLNTARLSMSRNIQQLFPDLSSSNLSYVPNEPINSSTIFIPFTDIGNVFHQPGAAAPGQIPQICNGTLAAGPSGSYNCSGVLSQYGSATALSPYATPGATNGDIYTLSDDVYWTKGKHAFKFGVLANRFDWFPDLVGFAAGTATFTGVNIANGGPCNSTNATANLSSCPLASYFAGVYSALGRATPNSVFPRHFNYYTLGFYAQDDVKATSRLTLNLGLRYEFATVPIEHDPTLAFSLRFPETDAVATAGPMFQNPSLHNYSPRIGFAYDVFGNGKTSIRGGAGIYYDIGAYGQLGESNNIATPNNIPGGSVSGTVTYNDANSVNFGTNSCCGFAGQIAGTPYNTNLNVKGAYNDVTPFTVPLPAITQTAVVSPRAVQYNINQPTLLQRSLGIDQQLPWAMALSVSYVGARDWHLYQEREGNPQAFFPAMTAGGTCTSGNIDSEAGCAGTFVGGGLPTACPGTGCVAATNGASGLPYYCSPADGTPGPPSAAHPCFSNATFIPCTTTVNAPLVNGVRTPSCPGKTNPAWNQVSNVTTSGDAYYNSLQVVLNKRTTHGLQMQLGYTWQKLIDTGTGQSTLENALNPHEFPTAGGGPNGTLDRGPSQYNSTDQIRANFVYRVPDLVKSNRFLEKVTNGWGVAGIPSYQTGYPQSLTMTGDRTLDNAVFVTERPDLCPGYSAANFKNTSTSTVTGAATNAWTGDRLTSTFFNPGMICLPALGTFGNSPKGLFTGPGLLSTNLSLTKDTKAHFLGESGNIEFRFDLFNVINHPNFTAPNVSMFVASASCPAGGSIASLIAGGCSSEVNNTAGRDSLGTLVPMRQMQVSLRVSF